MGKAKRPAPGVRPVQLQANTNGAWKTVLEFDGSNDAATTNVQQAVTMLYETSSDTYWRLVIPDRPPIVLRHLGKNTYGLWRDET